MALNELIPSQHQHRVLCVDDNELNVFVNATVLRSEGYEVVACSDPMRAAVIAHLEELDLAILDCEMPAMSGAELAAFCRAANPDIKIIIFSGTPTIPERELVFADLFVQKGEGVEVLLDAVKGLLTDRRPHNATRVDCVMQASDNR